MSGSPYASVFDVVVVGRAAVGLATALALARTGLRVAMVGPEAQTAPEGADWDNRIFALSPASRRLLDDLGAWQAMHAERIAPVHDMRIWPRAADAPSPPRALHFSAWQAQVDALAWIVENRNLTRALAQACRFAGFATFPVTLSALDADGEPGAARLTLSDGRSLRARLVVGADGANSRVRELAGIRASLSDYPQRAIVANFDTAKPHRDCACQWFGDHGILALLPLPASEQGEQGGGAPGRCSIVWSAPHALADELLALEPQALADRVEAVAGSVFGAMTPIGPAAAWPLRLGRVESLIAPRVALVGDAAHVLHPLAGQGMNLGFGDVQALAETMRGREPVRDPGERMLLRRYERSRAEPVMAMRLATDGLQKLFDPASALLQGPFGAPLAALRGFGWRAVASSGLLKRLLISQAIR